MNDTAKPAPDDGPAPISTSKTWSISVAARILNVSTAYLYKLVDANEIPHRRQGSAILFDRRELSDWFSKLRVKSR
jgi:excisionase family DNA binding protein